ncbi:N-succinyldiaminopimelate aminotransferase [Ketogulonicigenium robustum]|uniref:N-succinyldiaminopimelate aminotransferase n=1 Tax=Ketogulonicigenium robustum TaxID=92947 RepID=A0A1W6P304_9RHOB|nr:aminotransferase class I/II-fold pyridoxal phosphate-dependent enzyme [Ketogulonicigenium robustum]ARO15730.1 N-succinyldiaminopimelate aminotransferase [Ketogulonicigenium robustum]
MNEPERFSGLPEYAFPRLRTLIDHLPAGGAPISMTIGEPRHAFPAFVPEVLAAHVGEFSKYPPNDGTPELLGAISGWLQRRYGIAVPPAQIVTLNGTREGLYNAAMALSPETKNGQRPVVLMPNPFYQVYAIASISVGAEAVYVPATADTGHLPDFASLPADVLDRTTIAYICSPANPQGAVASTEYWQQLIALAEKHDFRIFADECYSEIWRDAPPTGALQVAHAMGADPERVVIFHSLSKRSNLPGLRSGFAAGGPRSVALMRQLRAYNGAPIPLPLQRVSERAWADEAHVDESRALYQQKYAIADRIFGNVPGYMPPQGGFFLWLPVPDGEEAAIKLWTQTGVRVLPGAYLSREIDGFNPGKGYIRVALVEDLETTERGLHLIRSCLYGNEGG